MPAAEGKEPNCRSDAESSPPARGFWSVEPRTGEDGAPDIFFKVLRAGSPADQLTLKGDVEQALSAILSIYSTESEVPKRDEAVGRLLKLGQLGLVGETPGTAEAAAALVLFKSDIVNKEAGRIKNKYMLKLGLWAGSLALIAWTAYVLSSLQPQLFLEQLIGYRNAFLALAGAMIGGWASFATRKVILAFEDLAALEEDRVEPPLRLIFTAVLTITLVLVFATGFANLSVGQFSSANILASGSVAALIGLLAGLSEKALPAAILKKASNFMSKT